MGRLIPDGIIDQIRSQIDIVDIVGQFVELKKRGRNWVGLCPFHAERTPSFTVSMEKGFFKCFGCGKAGDVYSFLMEHQKLDFAQAVEFLAERLGIALPRGQYAQKEDEARTRLLYANQFAAEFYHGQLVAEAHGAQALEYLKSRGLDLAALEKFGLGWAPTEREALKRAALGHGIREEDLLEDGLLSRAEQTGDTFDRFRSRVMFPILDPGGHVIGFGGRVLDKGEPKYLNTADTPLFHKGEVLYGLDRARGPMRREGWAIVVEGYMDLIALHLHGLDTAVAPLGTALTPDQARLLGRYVREVYLLYDADTAGLKATFRSGDELLEAGLAVRVITLPGGLDPDDFLRAQGRKAFDGLLHGAVDYLDRKMQLLSERVNLSVVAEKEKAADKLLESVARCRDELARSLYLKKTAEFIGVPESVIAERLGRIAGRARRGPVTRGGTEKEQSPGNEANIERYLLAVCIRNPEYVDRTFEMLGAEPFADLRYAAVFEAQIGRAHV
jgi:DNA primase